MSGPVQPPLTVETIDGATVGRPITKIKVTNGTLAVSGSTATLTISGGGGGTGTVTSVGSSQAFVTVASATTTPSITIGSATGSVTGVLTSTDWTSFNGKQDSITLTTTGSSGAATLIGSTLNIPQYSGGGGGTFSGSLADTQIAFGNTAADSIQGSANLTFDGSNLSVSGYIKSGSGLVTAPTYSFTAADDVGMYLTGTSTLHFTAGNSDLMNLQHDGTATNARIGNSTGEAFLSSRGNQNLTLQTNDGVNSGTIVIEDGVNGQISITPNGTGTIKLDGVGIDNSAIATGYVLKATSSTGAGWAAESGGGGGSSYNQAINPPLLYQTSPTLVDNFALSRTVGWGCVGNASTTDVTRSYDSMYLRPFIAPKSGDVDEVQVYVQTASASADMLVGIYRDDGSGLPSTKLGEATIDCSSAGVVTQTSITGTITLVAGTQYWYAWVRDSSAGSPQLRAESKAASTSATNLSTSSVSSAENQATLLYIATAPEENTLPTSPSSSLFYPGGVTGLAARFGVIIS